MSSFRFLLASQLTLAIVFFAVAASAEASVIQITAAGDPITGISATVIGGNDTIATAGTGSGQFPAAESPPNAIDQLYKSPYTTAGTKYLNFGNGNSGVTSATKGVGTGFYVTPVFGSSVVNAIQMATANDSPNRDPLTVSLEGSNATGTILTWAAVGRSFSPLSTWGLIPIPAGLRSVPWLRLQIRRRTQATGFWCNLNVGWTTALNTAKCTSSLFQNRRR